MYVCVRYVPVLMAEDSGCDSGGDGGDGEKAISLDTTAVGASWKVATSSSWSPTMAADASSAAAVSPVLSSAASVDDSSSGSVLGCTTTTAQTAPKAASVAISAVNFLFMYSSLAHGHRRRRRRQNTRDNGGGGGGGGSGGNSVVVHREPINFVAFLVRGSCVVGVLPIMQ